MRDGADTRTAPHGDTKGGDFSIYEDLDVQMAAPEDLALSLFEEGVTGVSIVERTRETVGDKMEMIMKQHALGRLPEFRLISPGSRTPGSLLA